MESSMDGGAILMEQLCRGSNDEITVGAVLRMHYAARGVALEEVPVRNGMEPLSNRKWCTDGRRQTANSLVLQKGN